METPPVYFSPHVINGQSKYSFKMLLKFQIITIYHFDVCKILSVISLYFILNTYIFINMFTSEL